MKTKTLVIITIIMFIILVGLSFYYVIDYNRKSENQFDDNIVSTIIMDINPSIKINLNKDKNVVSVEALNEDANEIIKDDYVGISFDNVVKDITSNLKEKGYAENGIEILLNATGEITTSEVETIVKDNLDEIEVEYNVIVQKLSDSAKEDAEKYNISESKASYIEDILKEKSDLTFEELKDKSINELENIKKEENKPVEDNQKSDPAPSYEAPKVTTGYPDPPASPQDKSAWCTWNANRPQWYNYTYSSMINISQIMTLGMNSLGLNHSDLIGSWAGGPIADSRSSYCLAYKTILTTKSLRTTILIDSVTGGVIEKNSVAVPTPAITKEQALKKVLDYFNLKEEDCSSCNANYGTNGEGSNSWYYRYDVSTLMKDGTYHIIDVNASTGEIVRVIR